MNAAFHQLFVTIHDEEVTSHPMVDFDYRIVDQSELPAVWQKHRQSPKRCDERLHHRTAGRAPQPSNFGTMRPQGTGLGRDANMAKPIRTEGRSLSRLNDGWQGIKRRGVV